VLRLRHYSLALIFVLAISSPVLTQRERDTYSAPSANSFEVVGQVRVADTGQPAGRVPIRLERFGGGLVDQIDTDSTGRFRFSNLQRGYYRVILNVPGLDLRNRMPIYKSYFALSWFSN